MSDVSLYAYEHNKNLSPEEFSNLLAFLSFDEQAKVKKFKFRADQEISLLSRFLLRQLLSSHLEILPTEIIFSYSEYQRPFLSEIDFNVSHAGDWIIIAIAEKGRVGVDVEKIRQVEASVADICFTVDEKKIIFREENFDLEKFFDFWTLKESFLKADGRGLSFPLLDFSFNLDVPPRINFLRSDINDKWYFRTYELAPEYKLALCRDLDKFPDTISKIKKWQELL